jgi:hypothetical protein
MADDFLAEVDELINFEGTKRKKIATCKLRSHDKITMGKDKYEKQQRTRLSYIKRKKKQRITKEPTRGEAGERRQEIE